MSFLKDGKDMSLKIQILEFLQENPQHFAEIKESRYTSRDLGA